MFLFQIPNCSRPQSVRILVFKSGRVAHGELNGKLFPHRLTKDIAFVH